MYNRTFRPLLGTESPSALTEAVDATPCAWTGSADAKVLAALAHETHLLSTLDPHMIQVYFVKTGASLEKEVVWKLDLSLLYSFYILAMTHLSSNIRTGEFSL